MIVIPPSYQARRTYSKARLEVCGRRLHDLPSVQSFPSTCIYVTGSYARLEAGEFSDIDLFFLTSETRAPGESHKLRETAFFSDIIRLCDELQFPPFSNDGEYLTLLKMQDMLEGLGGREDDYHNHFTARMLLLLESQPLLNEAIYRNMLEL
jgi:predicted nucleotidyltransferase